MKYLLPDEFDKLTSDFKKKVNRFQESFSSRGIFEKRLHLSLSGPYQSGVGTMLGSLKSKIRTFVSLLLTARCESRVGGDAKSGESVTQSSGGGQIQTHE